MLVDFIYLTLMNVFSENHASEADSNSKKVIQVIIHIQLYFQNISLLWHPNLKLSHWGTYQGFWSILSYPSLDSLLADLDLLPIYLLVAVSALSAIVVLLLICSLLVHYDKPLPALVLKPLKFLFFIFSHLYFIPTTIVLAILLKYTNSSTVLVEEYSYHVVAKDFYYGNTGLIIGICLLALHLAIAAIYECCSFEIRHSLMNIDITAKSTAKVDIMIKFLSFTRCLLYVAIAEFSYSTYIFVIAVTYAIGGGFLVCYIPNYSTFMNLLKAGIQIGSFFGALIFIVAYALADAEVAIVLMVFIQPSLIILINFGIQYRVSKIVPLQYCVTRNFLMFEISARESLASGTQERTILKSLNQNFKLTKNKSNFVMQAYYCSDILNDHMLALVKIFRVNHYDFSFLTNFQIFKCKEALQNYCIKSSDGFKMYSYLAKFRKNKSNHEDLCEEMLMLYEKILDKDVSLTTLKSCLNKFDESVELVKKQSLELLKLNPDSLVMLEMYGTLLSEVLGDSESAKVYLDKKTRANPALNRKKAMICMDESSCLMIVSGDKKKIGKILWANENMIRLLGSSEESMQESYLSHFIPKPFNVNHDIRLWKFVENCVSHHIFRSLPLFLANQDGFLVECYFNSECIGFEGEINFLSLIEPITGKNREVALISREGLIHSHSQNLPKLCKSPDKYIQGRALSEFLPNLDLTKLPVNTLCIMDNFGVEIAMVIKEKTIGSTLFHTIYISNDKSEISRWKNKDVKVDDFGAKIHLTLFKVNEGKASENEVRMNSSKKRSLEKKETVKMPENVLEEKKGITHTSSSKEINKLEMKLLQKAESKLNYMKFLVLLSVIFTQVIVIVVYNIAILVYINDEVSKATSLNTLNNLGELAYSISQISLISRFLDFNKNNPSFTIFTLNDLELKVNQTRTLNDELRNNPNEFQMCGYSYLLDENKMAYWEYTSQNHAQYGNLNDIISLILAKVKNI